MREQIEDIKRGYILEIASKYFDNFGFAKTKLDAIAKEAGVSMATIYAFFENKEVMFGAYLRQEIAKQAMILREKISNIENPLEKLQMVIDHKFAYFSSQKRDHFREIIKNNPFFMDGFTTKDNSCGMNLIYELIGEIFKEIDEKIGLNEKNYLLLAALYVSFTNGFVLYGSINQEDFINMGQKANQLFLKGIMQ